MSTQELSAYYSIDRSVGALVFGILEQPKKRKPFNSMQSALAWAGKNVFAEISSKDLADGIGASLPTALKIIDSRPDIFRKLGRGKWEVRDATADRQADKKEK
jgi:hypothetical protein